MNVDKGEDMADLNAFWSWSGRYVGYRISDCLFDREGRQLGYFAEGDEVYKCSGEYIGEVRAGNRLITNLSKKTWTRRILAPQLGKGCKGPRDVNAKDMLAGYEDFLVCRDTLGRQL